MVAEGVAVPCEINVLVTGDGEIRAINKASRQIDKATDVLSFPMFTLDPADNVKSWNEMLDPETGLCPLGDMAISLEELKEKGVISESEFNQQKENILKNLDTQSSGTPKSRLAYILLALFFGGLGIHNFYAGYTGKGITQLLLCVLLFWLVIPLIIVGLWVLIEIITVTKDAKGIPFN